MQKTLVEMNLQLPLVVSNIVGKTGLAILRRRRPARPPGPRAPRPALPAPAEIAAVTGHYRDEHVFVLTQIELFDMCQTQRRLRYTPCSRPWHPRPRCRGPASPAGMGTNPTFDGDRRRDADGIAPYNALKLIAEIGTDLSRWPTEHHFTAWLTLAPQNRVSGGRRLVPEPNRANAPPPSCASPR